ncbi:hypothetical protein GF376_00460, partial [Candidatus Peregrinibacteria bacterium]|nr:hypothetical protein [Candidatus Peregrinibacteria bacterium]
MKGILKSILFATLFIAINNVAFAATEPNITYDNCGITLRPFNPEGEALWNEEGNKKTLFLTKNNQVSQSECRSRIPYNQGHKSSSVDTDYQQYNVDLDYKILKPIHRHIYLNIDKQDEDFYYRSAIFAFQIELEDDAIENTETTNDADNPNNLTCSTPYPDGKKTSEDLHDCDGYDPNIWGGTLVHIIDIPAENRKVIEWRFGVDENGEYTNDGIKNVPIRYGNNSDLNESLEEYITQDLGFNVNSINLADQRSPYRVYFPAIALTTKDNTTEKEYWSATTTSRILVKNYAISKDTLDYIKNKNTSTNRKLFYETVCDDYGTTENITYLNGEWKRCTDFLFWNAIETEQISSLSLPIEFRGEKSIYYYYPAPNERPISGGDVIVQPQGDRWARLDKAYWIPLASTSTVWKAKQEAPAPRFCQDLNWDGPFRKYIPESQRYVTDNGGTGYVLTPLQAAEIGVIPTMGGDDSAPDRPLDYHWVSWNKKTDDKPVWLNIDISDYLEELEAKNSTNDPNSRVRSTGNQNTPTQQTPPTTPSEPRVTLIPGDYFAKLAYQELNKIIDINIANAQSLEEQREAGQAAGEADARASAEANRRGIAGQGGKFRDEISQGNLFSPFEDNDPTAYYTGGPEGYTVSVQAYYADGENVPGQGPIVLVPDNQGNLEEKQIAADCYLEFTIVPGPVVCTDLSINPESLAPNTPITFTVEPTFSQPNRTAPLQYIWQSGPVTPGKLIQALELPTIDISWIRGGSFFQLIPSPNPPAEFAYGVFKESVSSSESGSDAYLTPNRSVYYTGGPGNTVIQVTGIGEDGEVYPQCSDTLIIPKGDEPICENLTTIFNEVDEDGNIVNQNIPSDSLEIGKRYKISIDQQQSILTDQSAVSYYHIDLTNNSDNGGLLFSDPNSSCPQAMKIDNNTFLMDKAPVDCSYIYQPGENDDLHIEAVPHDNVDACFEDISLPGGPICQQLDVEIETESGATVSPSGIRAGQTYIISADPENSVFTDGEPIEEFTFSLTNTNSGSSIEAVNPSNNCPDVIGMAASSIDADGNEMSSYRYTISEPADINCEYRYTAISGDALEIKAVPDDGVAACTQILRPSSGGGDNEYCEDINLYADGDKTQNPGIRPGVNTFLEVFPRTTKGRAIEFVKWTETGDGLLQLASSSYSNTVCMDPDFLQIDDDSVVVPSICNYDYITPSVEESAGGFSVEAVLPSGVRPSTESPDPCQVETDFYVPPVEDEPYCVSLDFIDETPDPSFEEGNEDYEFNVRVRLSDGSDYQDRIRFWTNDEEGEFRGGTGSRNGAETDDFKTEVDNNNETGIVEFEDGDSNTGIRVALTETDIDRSSACYLSLNPKPEPPSDDICEVPPRIVREGNEFCDDNYGEDNAADNICWTVSGTTFLDGSTRDRGRCVRLEDVSIDFTLEAEDCAGSNICWDRVRLDDVDNEFTLEAEDCAGSNICWD